MTLLELTSARGGLGASDFPWGCMTTWATDAGKCRPFPPLSSCTIPRCDPSPEDRRMAEQDYASGERWFPSGDERVAAFRRGYESGGGRWPALSGIGAIETPELRPLPWAKGPSDAEVRKEARMGKVQEWALIVGLVGGAIGIYSAVRAAAARAGKKK